MGFFLSMIGLFYFSLCQKCFALTKVFSHSQHLSKKRGGGIGMAQLISIWQKMAHSCHFKIIVIPTSHPIWHFTCPYCRKINGYFLLNGSGQKAIPGLCQSLLGWSTTGRTPGPPWNLPPIYLPQKLTVSPVQSTSHTFFQKLLLLQQKTSHMETSLLL